MTQHIKATSPIEESATAAYDAGHYVEAIQLLHGFIENQARSFLMLVGCVSFGAEQSNTWGVSDSLSLHQVLKCLLILNQITRDEYERFNRLNAMRNKIVHRYFNEPYEETYMGVPKDEFDQAFTESLENAYFFTEKCREIVD